MIDISVIIPVYNAETLIGRCLNSVYAQEGEYTVEVICVDDGSTDNSAQIIQQRKENSITLMHQSNAGPAAARNRGIKAAKGRYVAFLDADDYWQSTFVQKTIDFLNLHKDCIAVSVAQRHITMSGDSLSPKYLFEKGRNTHPFVLEDFFEFWAKYNHVCTGSIVIRTAIAQETGGQREDLRICEDLEYWAYLATYGKFGFIPEVLFVSDGLKITKTVGWVEKNKRRWASAPTVEDWEKRIAARGLISSIYYPVARGRIARNLCYSILISGRRKLAYEQVRKYSKEFPIGKMSTLLRFASKTKLVWWIVEHYLIYREYNRK